MLHAVLPGLAGKYTMGWYTCTLCARAVFQYALQNDAAYIPMQVSSSAVEADDNSACCGQAHRYLMEQAASPPSKPLL